ncbi:hypothetical protein HNR46_001042 [Haloferula luteola]|uniref:Uncharacterized protein n=1 Tax=Haloferula luteola TaxID=595692 RepID=A0A840V7U4_9BACT|nr:hypothetical protein [Haloferula luteola]MBB5350808.1 hypothetical protein [Haloferula luteola]
MMDIITSLGLGPIIVVFACCAAVLQIVTGKIKFDRLFDKVFFVGCVFVSISGFFLVRDVDFVERGQSMLGTAMLGMMAFASFSFFREEGDCLKTLKLLVISGIPVCLYAFYQWIFGISAWEERYILTGLSKVLYSFYVLDGIDQMRPFSTMNTHTSLGAIGGTLFLVCFLILPKARMLFHVRRAKWFFYAVVGLLYLGTCLIAQNRTSYILPPLGLALSLMFLRGNRIMLFYAFLFMTATVVVVKSEWIYNNINVWSQSFEATAIGEKFGTLGTYQARLSSFMLLTEADNWTPFGLDPKVRPFTHDLITQSLVTVGYIPLGVCLALLGGVIAWWHSSCLKVKDASSRKLLVYLTAIIVALGVSGLAYGNLLFVAPVNSVLGLLLGLGMVEIRKSKVSSQVPVGEMDSSSERQSAGAPGEQVSA